MKISLKQIQNQLRMLEYLLKATDLIPTNEVLVVEYPSPSVKQAAGIWRTDSASVQHGADYAISEKKELPIWNTHFGKSKSEMSAILDGILRTLEASLKMKLTLEINSMTATMMILELPIDRLEIMKTLVSDGMEIGNAYETALRL